jgi:hypothetical protein
LMWAQHNMADSWLLLNRILADRILNLRRRYGDTHCQ